MASMFKLPGQQVVDANGNPYSGARLYFYDAGTSTPKDVYSDAALTTPLSQPVSADSAGRWVPIFTLSSTYRVELRTSADVLIANWDNFDPGSPVTTGGGGALSIALGGTGATTAAGARSNLGITFDVGWLDVASAATVDLGAQASDNLRITGTTTITSFGTAASGVTRNLRFAGALTLTHNATSLILPGGANITTQANARAQAKSLGGGNWILQYYLPALAASQLFGVGATGGVAPILLGTGLSMSGTTLNGSSGSIVGVQAFTTPGATTYTPTAGATKALVFVTGGGGGGGGNNAAESASSGGGAGATAIFYDNAVTSRSVTVGSGGAASAGANGTSGGQSAYGSVTANGGSGGLGASSQGSLGGAGATTTSGATLSISGGNGGATDTSTATGTRGGAGGASFWGGAGARGSGGRGEDSNGTTNASTNGTDGVVLVIEFA